VEVCSDEDEVALVADEEDSPRIWAAMLALSADEDSVEDSVIPALESYQAFKTDERLIEPIAAAPNAEPPTLAEAALTAFTIA
jgi:hypothetical protein